MIRLVSMVFYLQSVLCRRGIQYFYIFSNIFIFFNISRMHSDVDQFLNCYIHTIAARVEYHLTS